MTQRGDRDGAAPWEHALRRIQETTKIRTGLPEGFDPLNPKPDQHDEYGFPPEPNEATRPMQHAFWKRLLSPREGGRLTITAQRADTVSPLMHCAASVPRRVRARSRREQSLNWSGAYVTPKGGRRFTSVHGVWTVPALEPQPESRREKKNFSSIWVGLDGQREYLDASLPQVGTTQFWNDAGGQETVAWWQWWARGQHNPIMRVDLKIAAGHEIMAQVERLGPHEARFIIKNDRTGEITTPIVARAPLTYEPGSDEFEITGATAEWIVERPTRWGSDEAYELSNYVRVDFSECLAVAGDVEQDLTGAKLIDMFAVREAPHRKETISVAGIGGDRSLSTVYR